MKQLDFSGKIVFVTGGSGGIGSEICHSFIDAGATVFAPSSSELDLSSCNSIDNYLDNIKYVPDIIIHSAGINELAGFEPSFSDKLLFFHNFIESNGSANEREKIWSNYWYIIVVWNCITRTANSV